jgi:acetolactate synthase-1/2/3 large subunit
VPLQRQFEQFCEHGVIVHIDVDASEHNKNRKVQLAIESDIKYALGQLVEMVKRRSITKQFSAWHKQIAAWKEKAPFRYQVTEEVMRSDHMRDHIVINFEM